MGKRGHFPTQKIFKISVERFFLRMYCLRMNKKQTAQWKSEIEERRHRRRSFDLTLLTVAQRIGVSETTVWRWERGGKKPTQELIRAWDAALFEEAK